MMIFAAGDGSIDIVKFLVEMGANVNEQSDVNTIIFKEFYQ